MLHGKDVSNRLINGRDAGLPWMVILDADGSELITSIGPDGNVGCPAMPGEIEHFVAMIEQTCSDEMREKIGDLQRALNEYAKILLNK